MARGTGPADDAPASLRHSAAQLSPMRPIFANPTLVAMLGFVQTRYGVIRGIQRGTAVRNASYSLPNVRSSVGSSYATTKTWKASHNSAP